MSDEFDNAVPVEPADALDYVEPQADEAEQMALSLKVGSPRNASQALAYAWAESKNRTFFGVGRCLATVHDYYGVGAKYPTAEAGWEAAKDKHVQGSANIPRGVPVWWTNGRYGHVAISIGNGLCLSTDWKEPGKIDVARIDDISAKWGQKFQGWTNDINDVVVYVPPAPPAIPTVRLENLKFGKANPDVLSVKLALRAKGYTSFTVSGLGCKFFGPGLRKAYMKWQQSLGYSGAAADGIPGKTSLEKLGFKVIG